MLGPERSAGPAVEVPHAGGGKAVLEASETSRLCAYIVVSVLTGARTEELRALTWDHVDLDGAPDTDPPVPLSMEGWHSIRKVDDTKTRKSRRTLAMPARCVDALKVHNVQQDQIRQEAGTKWKDGGIVFATGVGT